MRTNNFIIFEPILHKLGFILFVVNYNEIACLGNFNLHGLINIIRDVDQIHKVLLRLKNVILDLNTSLAIFMKLISVRKSSLKENVQQLGLPHNLWKSKWTNIKCLILDPIIFMKKVNNFIMLVSIREWNWDIVHETSKDIYSKSGITAF